MGQDQARAQDGETSAGELVLGFLIDRPASCYQLDRHLERRFPSAQFARGTANAAVKRLSARGLVCVESGADSKPRRTRGRIYGPTPQGIEHFRAWIRASTAMPPVREELHAKIALCLPEDIPRLIEVVREAEKACVLKLSGLNYRLQKDREAMISDFERRMAVIVGAGDSLWWEGRIKWLQGVRLYLEKETTRPPLP